VNPALRTTHQSIVVPIRCPTDLPPDTRLRVSLLFVDALALRLAAAMTGFEGRQPFPVEAGDQLRHGIATPAPGSLRGVLKSLPVGHGEQRFGSRHEGRRFGLGPTQTLEFVAFLIGENA
jgi:hypothetical protein